LVAFSCKRGGVCPRLWKTPHGRESISSGRLRVFPINRCASGCSVSHSCPDAAHTFSLRQPSVNHGPGAWDSQSRHHHASGQEGRLFEKGSPHGLGNADPAVWTVRRLYALRVFMPCGYLCPAGIYALRVPAALNLNPNAARFTFMAHIPVRHPAVVQIGTPADLSYAVPGWGVCRPPRWISSISLGQFTDHPGVNSTIADYRPTSRTIS
jgi:hypothetical protein